ncbi:hypothetical protein C8J56DRAFT_1167647 [Mycena floridula]|nr:hypothetical protein C8J56DRAFT_1167647 [Mycena floridula]
MSYSNPDVEFLVKDAISGGYRVASLLVPPVYTGLILARRGPGSLYVNRVLRATWIGGSIGAASFGALAHARYSTTREDLVRERRLKTEQAGLQLASSGVPPRLDFMLTGGFIGAALTATIFWRRAHVVNLLLGGAGLGCDLGVITHYYQTFVPPVPTASPTATS